jgi:hypothetical protein
VSAMGPDPKFLEAAEALWKARKSYPGWHGYGLGIGPAGKESADFFVDCGFSKVELQNAIQPLENLYPSRVIELPHFRAIPGGRLRETEKALGPLQPGVGVFITNPNCEEVDGVIACFLGKDGNSSPPWVLSNHHILARGGECRSGIVVHSQGRKISGNVQPVEMSNDGNLVDAAVSRVDQGINAAFDYSCGKITNAAPVPVTIGDTVHRLRAPDSCAPGVVTYVTPHIDVDEPDSGFSQAGFVNQILIGPPSGVGAFAGEGLSGSLIVKNGGPAGLLFGINDMCDDHPHAVWGIASPFQAVLDQLQCVYKGTWSLALKP